MATANSKPIISKRSDRGADRWFRWIVIACGAAVVCLLIGIIILLFVQSWPTIQMYGLSFLFTTTWNPTPTEVNPQTFGAFAFIYGTIVTSIIALLLAAPFAIGAALYVVEYAPKRLGEIVAFMVELLVVIPSIAFGLWGLYVLVPIMRDYVNPFLQNTFGRIPIIGALFSGSQNGFGFLTAGVILAIMILPTILALSREVIRQVPRLQKEGMMAIGATKWETLRFAVLPYARGGIIGACMLGLARAIGETMAVTMVIGNSSAKISPSLFTPGYTLASAIANQFNEADGLYYNAVVELGLVLLLVSSIINVLARILVTRVTRMPGGGKA